MAATINRVIRARTTKYAVASLGAFGAAQVSLVVAYAVFGLPPVAAVLVSLVCSATPAYVLNRRWVWGRNGRSSWRSEVLPFWGLAIAGAGVAAVTVSAADWLTRDMGEGTAAAAVLAASIAATVIMWIARYVALDRWVFGVR